MGRFPLLALAALLGCHVALPLDPPAGDGSVDDRGGPVDDLPRLDDAARIEDASPPLEAAVLKDAGTDLDGPSPTPTRWATSYGTAGADVVEALAADSQGNVYVTGYTSGGGSEDVLVVKLSPGGTELWSTSFGGTGNDRGLGIAVRGSDVYVTGAFEGTVKLSGDTLYAAGARDVFLARLEAGTGNSSWADSWGSAGAEQGNGVAVDAQGTVYIVGDNEAPLDFGGNVKVNHSGLGDLFLVALQNGTTPIWARSAGGNGVDHGYGVHANANSVWVVGQVWTGGTTLHDVYVASYTADITGAMVFETTVASAESDEARAVVVDASGNGYVAGGFRKTLSLGGKTVTATSVNAHVFVAKLDPLGSTALWLVNGGGSGSTDSVGWGIAHAPGKVAVTGTFEGPADFGSTNLKPSGPLKDIFVATLDDVSGTFDKVMGWGSPDVDIGHAVGVGGGAVYIAGEVRAGLTIGTTPLTFLGGVSDGFVARVLP